MIVRFPKDVELIRRVRQGEEGAAREFESRVLCIGRFLYALNRKQSVRLDSQTLEDTAQKIFLELWSRIDEFRGEAPLERWIWRFCYFQYLAAAQGEQRERRTKQRMLEDGEAETSPDPETEIERQMNIAAIAQGLEALGRDKREILEQKHFQQMTFEEISKEGHLPLSTTKSRYYQALVDLRKAVERIRSRPEGGDDS